MRGFVIKPGDTHFRLVGVTRPGKLNGCVRDGNRCFLSGMVARRSRHEAIPQGRWTTIA